MADPGSGYGGPDAAAQAAGAAAAAQGLYDGQVYGYDSESPENEGVAAQDEAAAAAQASGVNLGNYQFEDSYENALLSVTKDTFNTVNGITDTNPYGKQGFFSRVFGIDPKKIDYSGILSLRNRRAIADNQFSKFANPQNIPGQIGYNPSFPTAEPGTLRSGVQREGYMTRFGPVMSQRREQGAGEMLARGAFGLLGGPLIGAGLSQMGTKEYGLPGQPGFESFDPNNPRGSQSFLGSVGSALTGGVDPTQAASKAAAGFEAMQDFFEPETPRPLDQITPITTTQIQEPERPAFPNMTMEDAQGIVDDYYQNLQELDKDLVPPPGDSFDVSDASNFLSPTFDQLRSVTQGVGETLNMNVPGFDQDPNKTRIEPFYDPDTKTFGGKLVIPFSTV